MDISEVLGTPGQNVDLGVPVPVGFGAVTEGEFSGVATPRRWPFTVTVSEISYGAQSAWGREDGRAVVRQFYRSFAELLEGSMEFVSFPKWRNGTRAEERYEVHYDGPEVEV